MEVLNLWGGSNFKKKLIVKVKNRKDAKIEAKSRVAEIKAKNWKFKDAKTKKDAKNTKNIKMTQKTNKIALKFDFSTKKNLFK